MKRHMEVLMSLIPSTYVVVFGILFEHTFGNRLFTVFGTIGLAITFIVLMRRFAGPLESAEASRILEIIKLSPPRRSGSPSRTVVSAIGLSSAQKRMHEILQIVILLLLGYAIWVWSGSDDKQDIFLLSPLFILTPLLALSAVFRWGHKYSGTRLPGIFGNEYVFLLVGIPFVTAVVVSLYYLLQWVTRGWFSIS